MIPTIFIDMDGVLADLNTGIVALSGDADITDKRSELFKTWLPEYVKANGFENQAPMPNAGKLVTFLTMLQKANPNTLLIDDHFKNINHFTDAGGHGIVYEDRHLEIHTIEVFEFLGVNHVRT